MLKLILFNHDRLRIFPEDSTHTAGGRAVHGVCYSVSSSEYCLELRAFREKRPDGQLFTDPWAVANGLAEW